MKRKEFKSRTLKISSHPGALMGTSTQYAGDPLAYAKEIAAGFPAGPEDTCCLVEEHFHKVGGRWKTDERLLGEWKYAELTRQ